jgi:dolichyl-phosphate beta-glucosyltransferase
MRTTVVVPCYNEAARLPAEAFVDFVRGWPGGRLLFVDDGSSDGTADLLAALVARAPESLALLTLPRNAGKAEAVRRGILHAAGQGAHAVGYWDADLATPLEVIPHFEALLAAHPQIDIVMGSRVRLLGNSVERKAGRHYLGRVFATVVSWMLQAHVYDTQCGAKLLRATPLVQALFAAPFLSRWVFDVELLARYLDACAAQGRDGRQAIKEMPLEHWRDVAGSKVRARDFARAGVDLARIARARRLPAG